MQSSQDEESPWVEDDNAPSHHAEAEWIGLSTNFTTAGYRDGISSGKEAALQEGFDAGFVRIGVPRGREIGVLRGLAAALLLHLSRSSPAVQPAQTRVREIVDKLAAVHSQPDEEATALHRAGANAQCGADEGRSRGRGIAHLLTTCARSARNSNWCFLRQGLMSHWAPTRSANRGGSVTRAISDLSNHLSHCSRVAPYPDTTHNSRIAHDQTSP
ncbi:hypothetical protein EDB83DRAFT_2514484 [Lactarius deliciosus]|nr:hypothetical protein EDB83DRAFT_2514484 [Lactarius deliciosus]